MKQIIREVLDDMSMGQINLSSNSARELIATTITAALKTKGSYSEYTEYELEEQQARASWVCSICGENTFEVDSDYIGSGTNHLGCELKSQKEIDEYIEDIDEQAYAQGRGSSYDDDKRIIGDRREGDRREDKVFKHQDWIDKLSEEVVSDNDTGYIYESPDGGKTVYKRKEGSDTRELVKDWKTISG